MKNRRLRGHIAHSSVLAWRIPVMGGAWWAAVYGVEESRPRLKRLSSSSKGTHFHGGTVYVMMEAFLSPCRKDALLDK